MKSTCRGIKNEGLELLFLPSSFPEAIHKKLISGLTKGEIPSGFHYETPEQAARWLGVHKRYSPARTDADCQRIYQQAAEQAVSCFKGKFEIVALGCGGGQKEVEVLKKTNGRASFIAVDISPSLVLITMRRAAKFSEQVRGIVCDLQAGQGAGTNSNRSRLVTLFGVVPNVDPKSLKKILLPWLRPGDYLLLSANMIPNLQAISDVLPGYDNPETLAWLSVLPKNLGLDCTAGLINFNTLSQKSIPHAIKIQATLELKKPARVNIYGTNILTPATLELFYSWRYTSDGIQRLLTPLGQIFNQWLLPNLQEGVYLLSCGVNPESPMG